MPPAVMAMVCAPPLHAPSPGDLLFRGLECTICLDAPHNPVVTFCGHLFCWDCLREWVKIHARAKRCPVCKAAVHKVVRILGQDEGPTHFCVDGDHVEDGKACHVDSIFGAGDAGEHEHDYQAANGGRGHGDSNQSPQERTSEQVRQPDSESGGESPLSQSQDRSQEGNPHQEQEEANSEQGRHEPSAGQARSPPQQSPAPLGATGTPQAGPEAARPRRTVSHTPSTRALSSPSHTPPRAASTPLQPSSGAAARSAPASHSAPALAEAQGHSPREHAASPRHHLLFSRQHALISRRAISSGERRVKRMLRRLMGELN